MRPPDRAVPLAGILLLGAVTLAWGGAWPAMKLGLSEIGPWTFRAVCLVVGGLGLLGIARAGGNPLGISRRERWPICLAALFNITGWHMFSAYGLTLIHASRAVIIAYTMPLWAVLLGRVVLREPLTRARGGALLLGLASLAVLIGPELGVFWRAPAGVLLMLGAAASWAAGTVAIKYFKWTMPTVVLTAWQVILGAIPVVLGQFVLERAPSVASLSLKAVLGTAYATLIGVIFSHYAWFKVVQMLPATLASIATLGVPAVGVFSSWVVLGAPAGVSEVVALLLVVPALALLILDQGLPARQS